MATPPQKLAQSLKILQKRQGANGAAAIRAKDITRTHRERLVENGFLKEVMRGWYVPTRPDEQQGDSTSWYVSFWRFCAAYLQERFGKNWCLSPEQSLSIHSGNWAVPVQLLVRSPKAKNNIVPLPHNTSFFDVRSSLPAPADREEKDGIRLFSLSAALIASAPGFFVSNPTDIRTALAMVRDASDILAKLLEGGQSVVAGRLAGAFRNIGRDRIADDIVKTMISAGYDTRETDPFITKLAYKGTGRAMSPYVNRLRMMWHTMRGTIIDRFPKAPGLPKNKTAYLKHVQEVYVTDAYHSLSIEGYKVTPELIERVASGVWNPNAEGKDKEQRDALAARGYWQTYQAVLKSLEKILQGKNPSEVVDEDHGTWYRELFAPSVAVGLLKPSDLAGYRNGQVYIRRSMHVPLNRDAVRDAMPEFFDLLREEKDAAIRVVLGHFMFVYIHPYMDGNGRIGRFMMNAMLAAGGYPWTVVSVEDRKIYMEALEQASVNQNILPFTNFLAALVGKRLRGGPLPKIPNRTIRSQVK
jgi:Fic/DOC family